MCAGASGARARSGIGWRRTPGACGRREVRPRAGWCGRPERTRRARSRDGTAHRDGRRERLRGRFGDGRGDELASSSHRRFPLLEQNTRSTRARSPQINSRTRHRLDSRCSVGASLLPVADLRPAEEAGKPRFTATVRFRPPRRLVRYLRHRHDILQVSVGTATVNGSGRWRGIMDTKILFGRPMPRISVRSRQPLDVTAQSRAP